MEGANLLKLELAKFVCVYVWVCAHVRMYPYTYVLNTFSFLAGPAQD